MKVLELCMSTGVGGLELYAVRTASQLLARHVDCIAVVADGTMTASRMQQAGVRVVPCKKASRFFPFITAKRLARLIDQQHINIIHMHWARDLNLAVLTKRFARRPVKLIYTRQMMMTRPKHDAYHRALYRHVDLFLTITRELTELARRYVPMPAEAIQTLYYGVQEPPVLNENDKAGLRQTMHVPPGAFAIGMVGRIEEIKGQHLVVSALKQLLDQDVNAHVTFIGPVMNQAYMDDLRKTVKENNLSQSVTFYGSHDNPIEIMSVFDVVVLATRQETFGLVLIEAMRNGVAVVGTNAGGVPEIIDDGVTGLLFEPENAGDLAEKLLWLCNGQESDEKRRMTIAKAGKTKADELFSQQQHYGRLLKFMSGLLNRDR
ncbi:MAG: glycosyltransferase family 4 protein [Gammaproteobacteria bacterium]|jgi:glycosyltransferase involved in cell wall biosynthesis